MTRTQNFNRYRGFSLIEVLVASLIGMIGLIAVFQVVKVWSKQANTTMSGGDAQITGMQAIFALDRDIRQAGLGFSNSTSLGCPVSVEQAALYTKGADTTFDLTPVEIIGGAQPEDADELRVLYGNSAYFTERQPFQSLNSTHTTKATQLAFGLRDGDFIVIENANGACAPLSLVQIVPNGVNAAAVTHTDDTSHLGSPAFDGGYINSLGPSPRLNVWQIATPQNGVSFLQVRNEFTADFTRNAAGTDFLPARQVAEGVVNLQAEYGYDADDNLSVSSAEWTTAAPAVWARVLAVRVAVLVRSQQFEKPAVVAGVMTPVTPAAPTWAGGAFVMKNIDNTAGAVVGDPGAVDPNDWRNYRYRVFEKVIPIRNMLWKCTYDCAH